MEVVYSMLQDGARQLCSWDSGTGCCLTGGCLEMAPPAGATYSFYGIQDTRITLELHLKWFTSDNTNCSCVIMTVDSVDPTWPAGSGECKYFSKCLLSSDSAVVRPARCIFSPCHDTGNGGVVMVAAPVTAQHRNPDEETKSKVHYVHYMVVWYEV